MMNNEVEDDTTSLKQEAAFDVDLRNGPVPFLGTEEKKGVSVALDNRINEGEARSLAVGEALECEERKDVSVVLVNADPIKVQALKLEEREEVAVVSGHANIENVHVSELEEEKEASTVSIDANQNEIPKMESAEKTNAYVVNCGIKEDAGLYAPAKSSSSFFSGKKLLVLDLNGLLAHILPSPPKDCVSDLNIGKKAIFKRPFCEDFLKFCIEKFDVGIWSSRSPRKIEIITDFLLGDMKSKLLFCWGISHCTKITYGSLGNKDKFVGFKELKLIWEKQDPDLPWKKGDYNETNTVLVDDSPAKALLNPPHTAIFPHSYDYRNKTDTSLGGGGDLRLYLEKLAEADNVQEFIKNKPFGQKPITKASKSWEFFSQIIGLVRTPGGPTSEPLQLTSTPSKSSTPRGTECFTCSPTEATTRLRSVSTTTSPSSRVCASATFPRCHCPSGSY